MKKSELKQLITQVIKQSYEDQDDYNDDDIDPEYLDTEDDQEESHGDQYCRIFKQQNEEQIQSLLKQFKQVAPKFLQVLENEQMYDKFRTYFDKYDDDVFEKIQT